MRTRNTIEGPSAATTQPIRRVLILAPAPAQLLDLAGPAEVFSQAEHLSGLASPIAGNATLYATQVVVLPVGGAPDTPATTSGVPLMTGPTLVELLGDPRPLDTLIIGGGEGARLHHENPALASGVGALAQRARRVASVCTGAFVLAGSGLLDGRRATTHWRWCEALSARYPHVRVERNPIFTRDGDVWTSAGVTAGIDLALALVEEDHGHALALAIARELVMFLRRPGGQAQFSAALTAQAAPAGSLRDLVAWIADNLHRPLTVDELASRACLSPRQFARVFARDFGISPARMVDRMRVEAARRRLEESPQGLAGIAATCGFGGEEVMRRAFLRHLGTPPGSYRDRFKTVGSLPHNEDLHA
jgi:transcriptional regulator GlxA family with amidase domain